MKTHSPLFVAFLEDLEQALEDFDLGMLSIEENPEKAVEQIFRVFHSIKASTKILAFNQFSDITHLAENLLSQIRNKTLTFNQELSHFFLKLYDLFIAFKEKIALGYQEEDFLQDLKWQNYIQQIYEELKEKSQVKKTNLSHLVEKEEKKYHIALNFDPDIFLKGSDPFIFIQDLFEKTKILSLSPSIKNIPPLQELEPFKYYISWVLEIKTTLLKEEIKNLFAFLDEETNTITILEKEKEKEEKLVKKILLEEKKARPIEFVRVPVQKLDELLNLFGELVIGFSQIETLEKDNQNPETLGAIENLNRILNIFQYKIMDIRMVSVAPLFQQFYHFVQSSAQTLEKKAKLRVMGEETELDKNLLNQIGEVLQHLIRNCLDHGLEKEEERIKAGKPPEGEIFLWAQPREDGVAITITDDGRGLDSQKILQKAQQLHLISSEEAKLLKPQQIYDFLFLPGFSTQEKVSDFSGRGVGLDVVKSKVESLRGNIEVESTPGLGTSFILKLPLTLSIMNTIIFRVGQEKFAVPIFNVKELVKFKEITLESLEKKLPMLKLRNKYYPMFLLNQFWPQSQYDNLDLLKGYFILLEVDNKTFFLFADEIIKEQQVVIKNLSLLEKYRNGILGTSILGNGEILFIIDVYTLTHKVIRDMDLGEFKENSFEK